MKVSFSKTSALFGAAVLAGAFFLSPAASAASFDEMGRPVVISQDHNEKNLNAEDHERVSFVLQPNGILRMYSRSKTDDFLSCEGYYGTNRNLAYTVRKIEMDDPDKTFFEVVATKKEGGRNQGYWIVGKHKGKWEAMVSLDTLRKAGYDGDQFHKLEAVTEDGNLYVRSRESYTSFNRRKGHGADFIVRLFWDDQAQWFGILKES